MNDDKIKSVIGNEDDLICIDCKTKRKMRFSAYCLECKLKRQPNWKPKS